MFIFDFSGTYKVSFYDLRNPDDITEVFRFDVKGEDIRNITPLTNLKRKSDIGFIEESFNLYPSKMLYGNKTCFRGRCRVYDKIGSLAYYVYYFDIFFDGVENKFFLNKVEDERLDRLIIEKI